jgi:hypothetical protein
MKTLLLAALAVVVAGLPAQAASILDPLLGSPGDCYYRNYDEAHLRSHPRQMVETIFLAHNAGYQDPNAELTLFFGITTRDGKSYEGVGICDGNVCGVEGDGGRFALTPLRDGLRLDVDKRRGMHAEGADGYIALEDTDDTVFLLYPQAPRACDF